jgi:glucose-1-phosphate thymidylyltransferase
LEGWWLDTGKKDDLLRANQTVLNEFLRRNIEGWIDGRSDVVGRVEIGEGTVVENSQIHGPVSIAEQCRIKNSFVGPFTSIGKGTIIEDSSLERSVVLEDCHIHHIGHLTDSLIGRRVELVRSNQQFKAVKFFVGDDARVEL